jgi:heme a synthase
MRDLRVVRGWLLWLWLLVMLMVMIGGITRLTGSGLSIVEWRPVTGALPPIGEDAWQAAFAEYQRSPQFVQQNHWMTLSDFQRIYFWEYVHRLFGRLLGLACALPWLYFVWKGQLRGSLARRTLSVLLLGGLQGAIGWFMVKSGLVNEPRVSHYRLALHLLLGMGVGQWILWLALDLRAPRAQQYALPAGLRRAVLALLPLLALQLVYGAFMAGTRAGYVSSTFPDINGRYAPHDFFTSSQWWRDLFDNPLSIHYLHRAIGAVVLAYCVLLAVSLRRQRVEVRAAGYLLLGVTLAQFALGALTVVLRMPLAVAVAHQGGGYLLCSAAVLLAHAALGAAPWPAAEGGSTVGIPADLRQA